MDRYERLEKPIAYLRLLIESENHRRVGKVCDEIEKTFEIK